MSRVVGWRESLLACSAAAKTRLPVRSMRNVTASARAVMTHKLSRPRRYLKDTTRTVSSRNTHETIAWSKCNAVRRYAPLPDGQSFVVLTAASHLAAQHMTVLVNWRSALPE